MSEQENGGWGGGFATAYRKGRQAHLDGKSYGACPYPDYRTNYHEGVTFSRAWRRAWFSGWDSLVTEEPEGEK